LDTTLRFDDDRHVDVRMTAITLSVGWLGQGPWSARASVGVVLDGSLQPVGGARHDLRPGGLVAFGVDHQTSRGQGWTPSLDTSFALSASWADSEEPSAGDRAGYFAADARLGARAVWRLGRRVFPYLGARVFGGPVNWQWEGEDVQGSDIHHYQLAVGAALQLGKVGLHLEWAGVGEQGASAGVSTIW
jgi:hypothetical protein